MARCRFVRPDVAVLPISDGQTITVKKSLNSGEERAMFARMYTQAADGSLHVNPLYTGLHTVLAYLIDWTLTDEAGAIVSIRGLSPDALTTVLDSLDADSFSEIKQAIEQHDAAMRKAREAEKNSQDGESKSVATSPSPVDLVGATSGS